MCLVWMLYWAKGIWWQLSCSWVLNHTQPEIVRMLILHNLADRQEVREIGKIFEHKRAINCDVINPIVRYLSFSHPFEGNWWSIRTKMYQDTLPDRKKMYVLSPAADALRVSTEQTVYEPKNFFSWGILHYMPSKENCWEIKINVQINWSEFRIEKKNCEIWVFLYDIRVQCCEPKAQKRNYMNRLMAGVAN